VVSDCYKKAKKEHSKTDFCQFLLILFEQFFLGERYNLPEIHVYGVSLCNVLVARVTFRDGFLWHVLFDFFSFFFFFLLICKRQIRRRWVGIDDFIDYCRIVR